MSAPIRPAAPDETDAIVGVITLAFSADPVARWSLPSASTYLTVMPAVVRAFGERAFDSQSAYCVDGFRGAALWLAPGAEPDGERLVSLFQEHASKVVLPDLMAMFEQMGQFHPTSPHWYLPLIGVDPACQGQGHGAMLMRHALERCDRDGVATYLESSNPRNISLYQRHGFEIMGEIQVGTSPRMVPMYRAPR